jgi:hypothetical protein
MKSPRSMSKEASAEMLQQKKEKEKAREPENVQ